MIHNMGQFTQRLSKTENVTSCGDTMLLVKTDSQGRELFELARGRVLGLRFEKIFDRAYRKTTNYLTME